MAAPPHRAAAIALVAVPLAAALVPVALPPFRYSLIVVRIALVALGPTVAVLALVLATVAGRLDRPDRRWLWAGGVLAAAVATLPTLAARRTAAAAIAEVDALPTDGRRASHDDGATGLDPLFGALHPLPTPASVLSQEVRYLADDGTPLVARLHRDTTHCGRPCPAVVVLYAGAWQDGDATQSEPVDRWLAGHGFAVVALDYRHAPAHRHPAQRDDVRRGLAIVRDSASAWGIDTTRVAFWGRSSGGHLATLAAWDTAESPIRPRAVIDYYGPFDLARGYVDRPAPDPRDVRSVLRAFVGGAPDAMPDGYRDGSPKSYVRPGLPPSLLVYASQDHLVKPSFGRDAAELLRAAGNEVVYVELPWAEHAFDLAHGGPQGVAMLGVVLRFLRRTV